jgi:ribosomal protein S18 acetylase RimI-like enzyme
LITYRRSRNTDPPALLEVWNETVTGRGGFPLRSTSQLERWLFSRPYFDLSDISVAIDSESNKIVGFSLSGFAPDEERSQLTSKGVICSILVRPSFRKQGIGKALLSHAEESLKQRGATEILIGSQWPNNPYLFGIYGGSNSPGILGSESDAQGFLNKLGYTASSPCTIYHRKLESSLSVADTRFGMLRRRYDVQVLRLAAVGSWWQDCQWGMLEPIEMRVIDKLTDLPSARLVIWELEGFSWRWNLPSAGIMDVQVRPDLRRQGLGKMLVAQALRFLQDQFFGLAEMQVPAADAISQGLAKSLGFEEIDVGSVYIRNTPTASEQPNQAQ